MKKSLSIWLLLVLFAPALVTISWLNYQKRQVKREVKWNMIAGIDKDDLVLLRFTKSDSANLRWVHAREFEYLGEMYDIVERKFYGDTTHYYCWWDYEETQLNKKLQTLLTTIWNANPEKHKQEDALIALYKSLFVSVEVQLSPPFPEYITHLTPYHREYLNLVYSPPVPPPEFYH